MKALNHNQLQMFVRENYREFTDQSARIWGKQNFGDWIPRMHMQSNQPETSIEIFVRGQCQGAAPFNNIYRGNAISNLDICETFRLAAIAGDAELRTKKAPNNIVVYRFVQKRMIDIMKQWSNVVQLHPGTIIWDKGFLSTTLVPEIAKDHRYGQGFPVVMKIYVPSGTPCAYMDLVSDMREQEILFPTRTKLQLICHNLIRSKYEFVVVE